MVADPVQHNVVFDENAAVAQYTMPGEMRLRLSSLIAHLMQTGHTDLVVTDIHKTQSDVFPNHADSCACHLPEFDGNWKMKLRISGVTRQYYWSYKQRRWRSNTGV